MKRLSLIVALSLCSWSQIIAQGFSIECEGVTSDSILDLDFVLKEKSIDKSNLGDYKSGGMYFDKDYNSCYYLNENWDSSFVTVKFNGGVPPFEVGFLRSLDSGIGSSSNFERIKSPGIHKVIATDSLGRKDSCYTMVHVPSRINLTINSEDSIDLKEYFYFLFFDRLTVEYQSTFTSGLVKKFEDLPDFDQNTEELVLLFYSNYDNEKVHEINLRINNLRVGDKCDDRDTCTINDIIRSNGTCIGTSRIDSMEIYLRCDEKFYSDDVTLYTEKEYHSQSWSSYGATGYGNTFNLEVNGSPHKVQLNITDKNGCNYSYTKEISLVRDLEVVSDSLSFCNKDERVELKVLDPGDFEKITWFDEYGNTLDTLNTSLVIENHGKYYVQVIDNNCYGYGSHEMRSKMNLEYFKLKYDNSFLCGDEKVISISPAIDYSKNQSIIWKRLGYEDYEVGKNTNWKSIGKNIDTIVVTDPGIYVAQVSVDGAVTTKRCQSYDQVNLYSEETLNRFSQKLRDYGLQEYVYDFVEKRKDMVEWDLKKNNPYCVLHGGDFTEDIIVRNRLDGENESLRDIIYEKIKHRLKFQYGGPYDFYVYEISCKNFNDISRIFDPLFLKKTPFMCLYYLDDSSLNRNEWKTYLFVEDVTSLLD